MIHGVDQSPMALSLELEDSFACAIAGDIELSIILTMTVFAPSAAAQAGLANTYIGERFYVFTTMSTDGRHLITTSSSTKCPPNLCKKRLANASRIYYNIHVLDHFAVVCQSTGQVPRVPSIQVGRQLVPWMYLLALYEFL